MQVHDIKATPKTNRRKRIVGRGNGSGSGKTSGRGMNGQNSRPGRSTILGFEGGQMTLIRRLPKVGFNSHRPINYQTVKVESLNSFKDGSVVDAVALKANKLIGSTRKPYKILGDGELKKSLTCKAYSFSKSAQEKITKAGGKIEVITASDLKEKDKQQKTTKS